MRLSLDEIAAPPNEVDELSPGDRRVLATQCASIRMALASVPTESGSHRDELLTAQEAAPLPKMVPTTLHAWKNLPFLVRRGGRELYSRNGVDRWNEDNQR
jgi:hypothetical protein